MKRYRVAQWGTGAKGKVSLRAIIEHPNLDLVGVKVYAEQKAGRDAGDLCGLGSTGVIATKNIEDIIRAEKSTAERSEKSVMVRQSNRRCTMLSASGMISVPHPGDEPVA